MGRKLSPSEADAFTQNSMSSPDQKGDDLSSYGAALQSRIAEALGLPVADHFDRPPSEKNTQEASHTGQPAKVALIRYCSDLIEAFASIEDTEERRRLLEVVRDVAQMSKHKNFRK